MNLIGDVKGKNVILRDDMIDTAGTLCNAAEFLKNSGAKRIFAACTHGVLSGKAIERIEAAPIEKMVICESIDQSKKQLTDKFEILTCSALIGEAIKRIFGEDSVSSLFEEKV